MQSKPEGNGSPIWLLPACSINGSRGVFDGEDSDLLARYMLLIYPIVFISVGVSVDVVSMVIWARRIRDSQGSTPLYLTALCGVDTIVLSHSCLRHLLMTVSCIDIHQVFGCKLPLFLHTWLSTLSVWIICLMCFERLVCVIWPFDMKIICRARNGLASLTTLAILCACVTIYLPVIVDVSGVQCDAMPKFEHLAPYFHTLDSVTYSYLPFALIVSLNAVIVIQLGKRRRRLYQNGGSSSAASGSNQRRSSNKIFFTVFCMGLCHLLFTAPIVVWHIRASDWCNLNMNPVTCIRLEFIWKMLEELNHLTHFFIFSFTSPVFMLEMKLMFPWLASIVQCSRPASDESGQQVSGTQAENTMNMRPISMSTREPIKNTSDESSQRRVSTEPVFHSEAPAVDCCQIASDVV